MAVAFDAKSTSPSNVASPTSPQTHTNMTVGSSLSNGVLLVYITVGSGSVPTITGVHWDSTGTNQAMTLVPSTTLSDAANVAWSALYGLVNPTSGNKTLSVTFTGSPANMALYCVSFSGVVQTSVALAFPNGNTAKNDVGSTTSSITITSATGDIAVAFHSNDTGGTFSGVSGTQLFIDNIGTAENIAGNYSAGAATVTLTATMGSTAWNVSGCDVAAAGGATTPFGGWFFEPPEITLVTEAIGY